MRNKARFFGIIAIIAIIGLLAAGCGGSGADPTTPGGTDDPNSPGGSSGGGGGGGYVGGGSKPSTGTGGNQGGETGTYYTVSFDVDGGSPATPAKGGIEPNGTVTLPGTDPTKEGFTFGGWFNGTARFVSNSTPVTANITLKAEWVPEGSVTIMYETYGGSSVAKETVADSANPTAVPADPTKTGAAFGGWWKNDDGEGNYTNQYDDVTDFTADVDTGAVATIYAKWTYDVKFMSDGAELKTVSAVHGEQIASGDMPSATKTMFTKGGWFIGDTTTEFKEDDTRVTDAFTLNMKWWKDHTIKFVTHTTGGSPLTNKTAVWTSSPATRYKQTLYTISDLTADDGKTFIGWYDKVNTAGTNADPTGKAYTDDSVFSADTTLHAFWQGTGATVSKPAAASKTHNSITVGAVTIGDGTAATNPGTQTAQYAIITVALDTSPGFDADTATWQPTPAFTGLAPNENYYVYARTAANTTTGYVAGATNKSAQIDTDKAPGAGLSGDPTIVTDSVTDEVIVITLLTPSPANADQADNQDVEYFVDLKYNNDYDVTDETDLASLDGETWVSATAGDYTFDFVGGTLTIAGLTASNTATPALNSVYFVYARTKAAGDFAAGTAIRKSAEIPMLITGSDLTGTLAADGTPTATSITLDPASVSLDTATGQTKEYAIDSTPGSADGTDLTYKVDPTFTGTFTSPVKFWVRTQKSATHATGTPLAGSITLP